MVGVPRSKGCSLCVRRRVKCDQVHPGRVQQPPLCLLLATDHTTITVCGNCVKYGADCPGYGRDLKFVSGKHAVRSKRTRGRGEPHHGALLDFASNSASPSTLSSSASTSTESGRSSPSRAVTLVSHDAITHGNRAVQEPCIIPGSLGQNCVPFIFGMMGQLFSIHSREEVVYSAPWFTSMLNYLGQEPVLDSAMSAFMLQMVGKAKRAEGIREIRLGCDLYGRALANLQRALNHPTAWKAVQTFAATIICCLYEVSKPYRAFLPPYMYSGTQDVAG